MQAEQHLRFGSYRLDLRTTQRWRDTLEVSLTPKALAVLRVLITRPGQVVAKEEFYQSVWNETVVSDDALAACIQELRRVLRDDARQPRYIETAHRWGYRFIGKVASSQEEEKQEAKGENGLGSSVQSLESENQTFPLPPVQTSAVQPPLPTPPARRFWSRGLLILLGLLSLSGGSIIVHYLSLPNPSTHPLTPSTQELPLPAKPSIVVLPFVNMSGDPNQEYFSDSVTEEITSRLSRIASLFVIARTSAFTYKGKAAKVQDISRDMGGTLCVRGERA